MKTKIENPKKNVALLEIELGEEKFKDAMQKAFNKNKKKFSVPGFRKGKAPWHIVQRFYGESVLYEDVVEMLYPNAYTEAINENDVVPVSRPEIDIVQIGSGKPFIFTAKFATKPDVVIQNYFGIEVNKASYPVSDEDVIKEIDTERESNARIITVDDKPIENGNICVIDYEGFIEGEPFDGGKGENHEITIGAGQFIPGFEEKLIGKNSGDDTEVNVKFPEDYNSQDLAGKEAVFKVKIHEIKKKELPELDDEYAKDISEFDTLDEYKKSVFDKLTDRNKAKEKNENERHIVMKIANMVEVDIPDEMVETRIDDRIRDYGERLKDQGMDFNSYISAMGMDTKTFRLQMRNEIIYEIKMQLALEAISKKEGIETTEEEIEKEIEDYAKQMNKEVDSIKEDIPEAQLDGIKESIVSRKTVELLVDKAVFVEKEAEKKEE